MAGKGRAAFGSLATAAACVLALALACALGGAALAPQTAWADDGTETTTGAKENLCDSGKVYKQDGYIVAETDVALVAVEENTGLWYNVYSEYDTTAWAGFSADIASSWVLDAIGNVGSTERTAFAEAIDNLDCTTNVTLPSKVLETEISLIEVDGSDAQSAVTSLNLSATSISDLSEYSPLQEFTGLKSIVFPASMTSMGTVGSVECPLESVTFTGEKPPSNRDGFGAVYLSSTGSVSVPAASASAYFSSLLNRSEGNGGFSSSNSHNIKIVSNGQVGTLTTKQQVFGVAGDSNPVVVDDDTGLAFFKNANNTTLTCIGYNELGKVDKSNVDLAIPSEVTSGGVTYEVTSIENMAFIGGPSNDGGNSTTLKSLTIPESVTSIGSGAFRRLTLSKPLVIPETVTNLGTNILYLCRIPGLTVYGARTVPDGMLTWANVGEASFPEVTTFGEHVFNDATLTSLEVNPNISSDSLTEDLLKNARTDSLTYISGPKELVDQYAGIVEANATKLEGTYYTVTTDMSSVGLGASKQIVEGGKTAKFPADDPERAGYDFAGWKAAEDTGWTFEKPVTKDLTVAPQWTLVAPKVTVNADNAKPVEGDTVTLTATAEHDAEDVTFTYQWSKDGKAIDGATEATLKVTEPGEYAVEVTAKDAAGLTAEAASDAVKVAFSTKPAGPDPDPSDKPTGGNTGDNGNGSDNGNGAGDTGNGTGNGAGNNGNANADNATTGDTGNTNAGNSNTAADKPAKPAALAKTGDAVPAVALAATGVAAAAAAVCGFAAFRRSRAR